MNARDPAEMLDHNENILLLRAQGTEPEAYCPGGLHCKGNGLIAATAMDTPDFKSVALKEKWEIGCVNQQRRPATQLKGPVHVAEEDRDSVDECGSPDS